MVIKFYCPVFNVDAATMQMNNNFHKMHVLSDTFKWDEKELNLQTENVFILFFFSEF